MPALNFKEIPPAHVANGEQDTFELFARDFLKILGLKIVSGPDRGQDGGRDLLAIEERAGIVGVTQIKWLVSCKHKVHSGESVKDADEQDIIDRVRAFGAQGFLGFYSTVVSAPLSRKLEGLKGSIEIKIYDHEAIEHELLNNPRGQKIAKRYLPESFTKWQNTNKIPSNILSEYSPLKCKHCGKDLLETNKVDKYGGIVVFVSDYSFLTEHDYEKEKIIDFYWSCKGSCDRRLENAYRANLCSTSWEDISDIIIPKRYLTWNIAILNKIRDGSMVYTEEAFNNLKEFIIKVSQLVLKPQTDEQLKRLADLEELVPWL